MKPIKGDTDNIWTTKEGREIPVKELTDDHLNNIITHLKNRHKEIDKEIEEERKFLHNYINKKQKIIAEEKRRRTK